MNSGIDAVIFDVDGTLYDYRTHTVPPSAQEALRCLREGGIRIIIASGRSYALLGESLVQIAQADHYVLSNGHEILDRDGRPVYQERFTLEETEGLLGAARDHGVNVMLKYHGFCCVYAGWDEMRSVFQMMAPDQGSYRFCPEWDYHCQELPLGVTLKGGPELRRQLADWETALRIEYFGDPSECDVFHHSANKWVGLERILSEAGVAPERCVAFGDSGNDVDMLRSVGRGIAMGNASPEAKAAAGQVCRPSWDDGIYHALRELAVI